MELFIDTADIEEIRDAATWGFIDGVTTNPSLIAKTGRTQMDVIKEIVDLVDGPISAEVIATDSAGMIEEGKILADVDPNVTIKIPMTIEGLKACKWFSDNKIKTNVTLVFSANQALLAAKNGATYISPFVGRLDDIGQTGMDLIAEIKAIYDSYGFMTKILAASIRHTQHLKEAALLGADVSTVPYKVLKAAFGHPLTDKGLDVFLKDHAESQQ